MTTLSPRERRVLHTMERDLSREPALVLVADLFTAPPPDSSARPVKAPARRRLQRLQLVTRYVLVVLVLAMAGTVVGLVRDLPALTAASFAAIVLCGVLVATGPVAARSRRSTGVPVS